MIADVIAEGMELLRAVRGLALEPARARLAELAARHPELQLHLAPERDEYTRQLEYGLLVRAPAVETAYVTCRTPSATPWLLQQVHDFREGVLLSVDGEFLSVGDAVASLDEHLAQTSLQERMVNTCVINKHVKERRYDVSDEELQVAVDEFRQRRGLLTAEITERWMHTTGMTHARLEAIAATSVRTRKLRADVCGDRVETYFRDHRDELATAALVRLHFATAELARGARARGLPFFALAEQVVGEALRGGGAADVLDAVVVTHDELTPAFAAEVFVQAGAVVGPELTERGAYLAHVAAIEPARELDAHLRAAIQRRLFDDWLRDQRASASIRWNWGHEDG